MSCEVEKFIWHCAPLRRMNATPGLNRELKKQYRQKQILRFLICRCSTNYLCQTNNQHHSPARTAASGPLRATTGCLLGYLPAHLSLECLPTSSFRQASAHVYVYTRVRVVPDERKQSRFVKFCVVNRVFFFVSHDRKLKKKTIHDAPLFL